MNGESIVDLMDPVEDLGLSKAVATLEAGGLAVLCSDDGIESDRGDLIFLAEVATTSTVAFAIRNTSGFLQVALPSDDCDRLGLPAQCGADFDGRLQCVSVDARDESGTGISARDRARTLRTLADPQSGVSSFTRPGHVVPVRVTSGSYLAEDAVAAAALKAARLTGGRAAAAFATLVRDSGELMCGLHLRAFTTLHDIPIISLKSMSDR